MHVRENEWDSVGSGRTREGASMYLHALCTTWNEYILYVSVMNGR
jgi:hypothetical protein